MTHIQLHFLEYIFECSFIEMCYLSGRTYFNHHPMGPQKLQIIIKILSTRVDFCELGHEPDRSYAMAS